MDDRRGNPISTASAVAAEHAERALWHLHAFYDTPLAELDAAAAADPGWMLPPIMRAAFLLTLTEPGLVPDARAALRQARALAGNGTERERAHLAAAEAAAAGRWQQACQLWDALLVDHPRDALALVCAHLFDFYRGDAQALRQRVARVLPEWARDDPLHPYVLGMHAFGLEECNLYPEAEAAGRAALDADPRGPWAIHAVAHVMEMQGRHEDGTRWLAERRPHWAEGNGLGGHCGWHLALFHLERLDVAGALALYDEFLAGDAAQAVHLQRLDGVAMLWRLHLLGADAGTRWRELASRYAAARGDTGFYAFNDVFALLAFIGDGDLPAARELLADAERRAAQPSGGDAWSRFVAPRGSDAVARPGWLADDDLAASPPDNRAMAIEVGLPLMHGLVAYAEQRPDEALQTIAPVRAVAHRFGGSHAQRDVIDQTLLAAAAAGGGRAWGRALLNERRVAKPMTPLTDHWARRLGG